MKAYFWNIFVLLSKALNVIVMPIFNPFVEYKFGDHRDSTSEVLGRNKPHCKLCRGICKLLSFILKDELHCENSIED